MQRHEKVEGYGNVSTHLEGERVLLLKEFVSRPFALFAGDPITFLGSSLR
jgi:hypothetical protein